MKLEKINRIFWLHLCVILAFAHRAQGSSDWPKNCAEIQSTESGFKSSQKYVIYPFGPEGEPIEVVCDFETEGGSWTIIQKRSAGPKDEFYRDWVEYEQGFGSVDENFWIGLKTIHALTKECDQELRIDLWDFEGDYAYAKYSNFSVGDSLDFYRLSIAGYSGTAGDALNYHNGMRFSTKDRDNDESSSNNCAESRRGAWWYSSCSKSNLNGLYYENGETQEPIYSGILWDTWKYDYRSLMRVEIKIRNEVTGATTTTGQPTTGRPTTEEPTTEQQKTCSSGQPKSCAEISSAGSGLITSQICTIFPFGPDKESVEVLCDFETEGGGWTIFQKRSSGPKEEFYRDWVEYEKGFGSVSGNFWIGLKTIYALTKDQNQEFRVDLVDFAGEHVYAKYSNFSISNSSDFYRLTLEGYSGTAGDSMTTSFANLNGANFSTKDNDNDDHPKMNCAVEWRGAWWYTGGCSRSNLNGFYYEKVGIPNPEMSGIVWFDWKNSRRSLQQVEMKIRNHGTSSTTAPGQPTTGPPTTKEPTTEQQQITCLSKTGRPKSCAEFQSPLSGVNLFQNCVIYPFGSEGEPVEVLCDFETEGGGWTIIQKRSSGPREEFYRNWSEYERGFGSLGANFWIGLKTIHALTKDEDQELRIDLWDFEGNYAYANYFKFGISNSSDYYRLSVGGYSGTAGDEMVTSHNVNSMRFTTKDKDNDRWSGNCATAHRSAWWFNSCTWNNLNGLYYNNGETPNPQDYGMFWFSWKNNYEPIRQVEMKIRNSR